MQRKRLCQMNFLLDQFDASPFTLKLNQNFEALGESPYSMEVITCHMDGDDFEEEVSPYSYLKIEITRISPYKIFTVSHCLEGASTPDHLMTMLTELCSQINTCQLLHKILKD